MLSSDKGEDELFFDSLDGKSFEPSNLTREVLGSSKSDYEMWLNEPQSVQERRQSFFQGMGFLDFASKSDQKIGLQRITESSGAVSSSSVSFASQKGEILVCCGREQNCETNSMVDEMDQDGSFTANVACENDVHVCSPHVQGFKKSEVEEHKDSDAGKKKKKSWWKHFVNKRKDRVTCAPKQSEANPMGPIANKIKVKQNKKNCMEFTGVYKAQEIQAHKGLIRTMKFSSGGQYLATGGEDGVVRIWRVMSVDASCKSFTSEGHFASHSKDIMSEFSTKKMSKASVIIPDKVFWIEELPLQEFHGHVGGVLDLAWSNSHYLLSASADKTVRLWQVGCNHCLNVFQHSDYVTCIQFNPVDETYFISGSIDGKVRIWGASEKRVVDWADIRDVISAICYQPDGKGFVVGCITGSCRFYDVSGSYLQLEAEINFHGRRKASGSRITGIQSIDERSQRVMITSEDSKIRILDGVDIVAKFKGLPRSGSQMSASLTSTGRHIISVGEDCHVYVWNYDGLCVPSSKHPKSAQSFEHFLAEGVSVALPWSGMGKDLTGLRGGGIRSHKQRDDCASCRRDSERFSLGNWLFMDGPCRRSSATWPEEKLPLWEVSVAENGFHNQHHGCLQQQVNNANDHHAALSDAWDLVIVTAGCDGTLKTFHNYGLPIRLKHRQENHHGLIDGGTSKFIQKTQTHYNNECFCDGSKVI